MSSLLLELVGLSSGGIKTCRAGSPARKRWMRQLFPILSGRRRVVNGANYCALTSPQPSQEFRYIERKMSLNQSIVIRPAKNLAGSVRLPGDKSISHRYAMLGAIASGETKLENFSTGADCVSTLGCLCSLGVTCEREESPPSPKNGEGWGTQGRRESGSSSVVIHGEGAKLQRPSAPLDCGNSGSTIRMLSGILAGQGFSSQLAGDESLSRRPMARIIQ